MITTWTQYTEAGVAVFEAAERAYRRHRHQGVRIAWTAAERAAKAAGASKFGYSPGTVATTVRDLIDPFAAASDNDRAWAKFEGGVGG